MEALELSVRSGLPLHVLQDRLGLVAHYVPTETGFGAVMRDAFMIDCAATVARYRVLHAHLPDEVRALADTLRALQCDVVVSNVSYIAAAAAASAGIPSVLFSSLTWHEVLRACCPEGAWLADEMLAAYRQAGRVLQLVPGTDFEGLHSEKIVQPIARIGRRRQQELRQRIGAGPEDKVALLAFGGMMPAVPPPVAHATGEFRLIGPAAWRSAGITPVESVGLPFEDLLASVDVVVSKPGYGIVTELACVGTPSVLLSRPDWPEEPHLSTWLAPHARCLVVPRWQDVTAEALRACLDLPPPVARRPQPGGEAIVAAAVRDAFAGSGGTPP